MSSHQGGGIVVKILSGDPGVNTINLLSSSQYRF